MVAILLKGTLVGKPIQPSLKIRNRSFIESLITPIWGGFESSACSPLRSEDDLYLQLTEIF